ncbi:MAG: secretin and TonB N-terminal domain-containing protein [Pseudomonadota bacterium]
MKKIQFLSGEDSWSRRGCWTGLFKIYYGAVPFMICLALWAGDGFGAEPQGKELTMPVLEEAKSLETGQMSKEKLYSLTVRDADFKEVLFAFSKDNGVNIIVDPKIDGKVTVDLKKVTLNAALDAILKPLELDYVQEGNLIRVTRPKMETRTFVLNYLTTVRSGTASVSGIGGSAGGTTVSTAAGGTSTTSGGGSLVSQVKTEDKADLWTDIRNEIKNVLSPEGKILINKMSSTLVVTDYPKFLREVERFINKVEETVQRQVYIEAKVIEVQLNDSFQLGIDWRLIPNIMGSGFGGFFRQSLSGTANYPAAGNFQIGVANADVNALVDALSTQGRIDIISSPRVSTLNNQKAIIKAAVEDVYFDVTVAAGTPPITTATPKYITIGLILDVTPQIDADGTIIMDIHPSVTERIRTASFKDTGQQAPVISVRETQTIVRVRDGQTVLIAGLMSSREKEELTGVPCLMNVPVAGEAFRHTRREKTKSEIVILITPSVYTTRRMIDFTQKGDQSVKDIKALPSPSRNDLVR